MPYAIWSRILLSCAGLIGAWGVGLAAAGAHLGGGDFAKTAAIFLLIHAAVTIAATGVAIRSRRSWPLLAAITIMLVGVVVFSGDLSSLAFSGVHVIRGLAPTGGGLMIAGWVGVAVAAWF